MSVAREGVSFMRWLCAAGVFCGLIATQPAQALEPRDVIVIVNKNLEASRDVAETYLKLRNVPRGNVIELDLPIADDISREDYLRLMVAPLRSALKDRRPFPRVLLTIYGVPLRVGAQTPSAKDREELTKLKPALDEAQATNSNLLNSIRKAELDKEKDPQSPLAEAIPKKQAQQQAIQQKIHQLEEQQRQWLHLESQASVDSELMLLWWDNYPLARWVVNPLYWQFPDRARAGAPPVMMTARLDGPSPKIAKRLVQDAVETEKNGGLVGKVYIDARGIPYDAEKDKAGTGYGGYDESFREAARLLREQGRMDVTLDDQEALFQPRSCPDCALYAGWYAVQNYQECCRLKTGAVAWHLASFEAVSLRHPGKQWAGNLLADGAAATIGPVAEPYTIGFPKPAEFLGFLVTGQYTLVECYARSTMLTSWMMVLVGDPLYNPYAKTSKLKSWDVLPSPRGSKLGQP
jgi:uncharacterized protein (TIGR03790 family)